MRVRLKKHIDLYDLQKDHWCGCERDTFNFLRDNYSYREEFNVTTNYGDRYIIDGHCVVSKCFDIISDDNANDFKELFDILREILRNL